MAPTYSRRTVILGRGKRAATVTASLSAALIVLSLAVPSARADPGAEGEPAFGISGYFKSPPRLNEPSLLLVRVWGEDAYDRPATSGARVTGPWGSDVV